MQGIENIALDKVFRLGLDRLDRTKVISLGHFALGLFFEAPEQAQLSFKFKNQEYFYQVEFDISNIRHRV